MNKTLKELILQDEISAKQLSSLLSLETKNEELLDQRIQKLLSNPDLPDSRKQILLLALYLTDQLEDEEDKGNRYFDKPDNGIQKLRKALWKNGFFYTERDLREAALRLATLRNLPDWLFEEENPQQSLGKILADQQLIKDFDKDLLLDYLKLIHPDHPNLEKLEVLVPEWIIEESEGTPVIMLSGLPASGKDTFIRNNYPNMAVVSLDDIRVEKNISPVGDQSEVVRIGKERAVDNLKNKVPFIWNATSLTKRLRKQQYDLFKKYGGKVKIVYLETDFDRLLERNEKREATVPEEAIDRMMNIIDPPSRFEADEVEWILS